jgi:hypothetical protein
MSNGQTMNEEIISQHLKRFYNPYISQHLFLETLNCFSVNEQDEAATALQDLLDASALQALIDACPDERTRQQTLGCLNRASLTNGDWLTTLPFSEEELALIISEALERSLLTCRSLITTNLT